jgi:hypothetical protein
VEVLPLIQVLWRRRVLVALGIVAAVALGLAMGGSESRTGYAKSRVVLDTPRSQLIATDPPGADSLPWRASLMVHLMGTDRLRRQVALEAGLRPDRLVVIDPALADPDVPASLPKGASEAAATRMVPNVVTLQMADERLPIISIVAEAPSRAAAARLDAAAATVLKGLAPPAAAPQTGPRALQGFVVEDVGPVRARTIVTATYVKPVGLTIAVLVLWCGCLLLLPRLWRPAPRGRVPHARAA